MRRTELLQGLRMMKFEMILERCKARELRQLEASKILGVTERTFRRWRDRYEDEGLDGLYDRRLGAASAKRVPVDEVEQVLTLYRERYRGLTAKHFHEKLVRHHAFRWGYTWTKTTLQRAGLVRKAKRRGAHRKKRPRRPLVGMMLHQSLPLRKRGTAPATRGWRARYGTSSSPWTMPRRLFTRPFSSTKRAP